MLYIFLFVSYGVSNLRGFLSAEPNQGAYRVVFYWSYFVREGQTSTFSYSSLGATSRKLEDGSWDAWSWNGDMSTPSEGHQVPGLGGLRSRMGRHPATDGFDPTRALDHVF